jgi:hypothetical protein
MGAALRSAGILARQTGFQLVFVKINVGIEAILARF